MFVNKLLGTGGFKRTKDPRVMNVCMGRRLHITGDGRELRHMLLKYFLIMFKIDSIAIISNISINSFLLVPIRRERRN